MVTIVADLQAYPQAIDTITERLKEWVNTQVGGVLQLWKVVAHGTVIYHQKKIDLTELFLTNEMDFQFVASRISFFNFIYLFLFLIK